jgi:DNA repair photolyase
MKGEVNGLMKKFWPPSVTSQFRVCPVPFHFDTYRGCRYGCLFCFARDLTEFGRRNKDSVFGRQDYLESNDPYGLLKWCEKVMASPYNFDKAEEVAFKERIPVKIGATADPFPVYEKWGRITYNCLKVFGRYDYPVQISTKNPEVFLSYAKDFVGANIALNVRSSFCDDDVAAKIETGAIPPSRRFMAIKELSKMGFRITVRIQPFILPYAEQVAERYVKTLKDIGAWGFQTEGLKLRVTSSDKEKRVYKKIGDVFGFDIMEYFKEHGEIDGGDRVYGEKDRRRMLQKYTFLSQKYGIRFLNADNLVDSNFGSGCECCGTEFLRNHRIWGGSVRSLAFGSGDVPCSELFGKCKVNFTRNSNNREKTIADVCNEYCNEVKKKYNEQKRK